MTLQPPERALLHLAESLNTHLPLGPKDERVETSEYVVWFGSDPHHPAFTVVQRLRLAEDRVDAAVAEIRALVAARGRSASTWEVGPSATPGDLAARLLARGFAPFEEPTATGMILRQPLPDDASAISTRRAESVDDYVAAYTILHRVFGERTESDDERRARAARDRERHAASEGSLHLGLLDGRPVAAASSIFVDGAVVLAGGATLEEARGKGAYRALVRARYDEAVKRGTPTLVIQAGAMSRPILLRLGFEAVAEIRIFTPPS
ncbi:MAG: hypothetical protein U0414_31100 [Polyangiaceae bacterium]